MESNGLRLPANYNLIVDFPFDSSRQERIGIFDAYFSASPLPENMEALVCMDDTLAMYFLSASSNRRRRINGQLSIMGISNKPLCEELVPKLTSVEIPFFNDAKTIIETLYSVFEGGEPECHLKSSVKIIQRQSA